MLAGCGGGGPRLAHTDAEPLISLTHRIAHEDACAQARDVPRLQAQARALVNTGRVPAQLQEPLMSGVNALVVPVCLPRISVTTPAPPAPQPHDQGKPKPPKHHEHHGHGEGD